MECMSIKKEEKTANDAESTFLFFPSSRARQIFMVSLMIYNSTFKLQEEEERFLFLNHSIVCEAITLKDTICFITSDIV